MAHIAARHALKSCPPLRRGATSRRLSWGRTAARACASSVLPECDARRQRARWSAALLALAATPLAAFATEKARAEEGTGEEDDEEPTKIVNWSGTHAVELAPGTYREPETMDELVKLVATAYREGRHIRPVGSALSPNGLAFDRRGMVSLANLDKIIDIDKEKMTVTVEAGARVNQVLDALRPHGLTLPNLASIAEQQIGGFVSVGAHGTGAAIPPCDEFVTALKLVTPSENGVVTMTEASHGGQFRLARLGLGGLGILGEVTLQVIPAHRLVEQTLVLSRSEAKTRLTTLLKRHKHVRYMWIPYEDAVVVVTNDPEDALPLLGPGTTVDDGEGGKKKIITDDDLRPQHTKDEQLAPLRGLLRKLLENKPGDSNSLDEETILGMGFGDLRDVILAAGNMLDPDHVKKCNRAEREFWVQAQGLEVAPSDRKLQFDCGGQQWVHEVCFPAGTYGRPQKSVRFVEELLREIEASGTVAAPAPIEQRWSAASRSPLSPASAGPETRESYEGKNALFSWVGVIMYLPSEEFDASGLRRDCITRSFQDEYCKLVRRVGEKYGVMSHWAKLELSGDAESDAGVAERVRARFGPTVVGAFNAARDLYDPKRVLSCPLLDKVFGSPSSDK